MAENNLINTLKFCEDISNKSFDIEKNDMVNAICLIKTFKEKYEEEKRKIPYHLNLIDELRANENAHSRILVKLLSYEIYGKFPILNSFVDYLAKKYDNFTFAKEIKSPELAPEKHRIDVFIREKDYAIIIENKIHYAEDQEEQIINYIERARELKINEKNIFVIYLSNQGGSPNEKSFPEEEKKKFENRYLEISYRYDIIPWLENHVLPNCRLKEEFLISAIQQYIDHLQGMFNLRKIEKDMNEKLINELEEKLDLKNNYVEDIEIISKKIKDVDLVKDYLHRLMDRMQIKAFKHWEEKIRTDFGSGNANYKIKIAVDKPDGDPKIGLFFDYNKLKFFVYIGIYKDKPYYAIGDYFLPEKKVREPVSNFLKDILNDFEGFDYYRDYGYTYTTYEDVYKKFKNKVNEVLRLMSDDLKNK